MTGYIRTAKSDDSELLDLQRYALTAAGVPGSRLFEEQTTTRRDPRPQLEACMNALEAGDTLVVWRLDRLGRDLAHLVRTVQCLADRQVDLRVLKANCGSIDTSQAGSGPQFFNFIAALAEFERYRLREWKLMRYGPAESFRSKGRKPVLTKGHLIIAQAVMRDRDANIAEFCRQLGISTVTLYRYIAPDGTLREKGVKLLNSDSSLP
ncbi:MAG: recombinase family protein [Sneathiellaceae bacterium]